MIVQPECPVAVWALPRSRQSPFLDTLVAEDVPARLDHRVLEVLLADGTDCHNLVIGQQCGKPGNPASQLTRSISYSLL